MNRDLINEHYYGDPSDPATVRARARIHWICSQARGQDILDIGCSQGIACLILGREGFHCTGIDIEAASVAVGQEALAKEADIVRQRVSFQVADATLLPFPDETFDTVVLGEIVEHLAHPAKVLAQAKRVLRNGARLVVTVPYGLNAHPDHKQTFYPLSLLKLLQPLLQTARIETLGNYILYVGVKDPAYELENISPEVLLEEYSRLGQMLEERCLSKERSLLETSTKLYAQIKNLEVQSAGQVSKIKGLEEQIAAKDKQSQDLKRTFEEERALANSERAALEELVAALDAQNAQLKDDLAAKTSSFQRQLAHLDALHAANLRDREKQQADLQERREADWKRRWATQRVREAVRLALPPEARVLVISKGDDDLLRLDGRSGSHFPQAASGVYAGFYPADSAEAIKHLEILKAKGAEFLLIPASSFWWLDFYTDFRRYLESQCRLLVYNEDCLIFALSPPPAANGHFRLALQGASVDELKPDGRTKSNGHTRASVAASNLAPQREVDSGAGAAAAKAAPGTRSESAESGLAPARQKARVVLPTSKPGRKHPGIPAVGRAERSSQSEPRKPTLGCILDEFTAACLRPDCNLITFRPDNWKTTLESTPIDALFVESAWHGNGGSWQYKIASFQRSMGEELVDVVKYCKDRNIPTVFWNKEDPPNFNRFIHRAMLFDYVFTSDADMIPKYRDAVKHDRVFALPFAAQPEIHNPIVETDRLHNVCFAGAYYGAEYDERRADMDHLLRPALSYGLHIYDRQHGVVGTNAKAYQFPEIYQPAIKGRLEYDQMVKAYKWYKVFLNVNSVKQSPTMFSRRVFELLASGTPVISSYSKGILALLGSDLVHIAQSEQETASHLERLLKDETYWAQVALKGIREVLSRHTYAHRLAEVCQKLGLPFNSVPQPRIAVFAVANTAEHIQRLTRTLAAQTYRNFNLTIITAKAIAKARIDALKRGLPGIDVHIAASSARFPEPLLQAAEDTYIWLLNLDDCYGENFLKDAALAALYSDADVIGKHTCLEVGAGTSELKLTQPGAEFRWVRSASAGSILARAGRLNSHQWKALAAGRMVDLSPLRVLSIDRFNYIRHGGRNGSSRGADSHKLPALASV